MDLPTRKLNLIEFLIGLQDEELLNKIEATAFKSKKKSNYYLKQFSKNELIERAQESDRDYQAGKYKTQEELEREL